MLACLVNFTSSSRTATHRDPGSQTQDGGQWAFCASIIARADGGWRYQNYPAFSWKQCPWCICSWWFQLAAQGDITSRSNGHFQCCWDRNTAGGGPPLKNTSALKALCGHRLHLPLWSLFSKPFASIHDFKILAIAKFRTQAALITVYIFFSVYFGSSAVVIVPQFITSKSPCECHQR